MAIDISNLPNMIKRLNVSELTSNAIIYVRCSTPKQNQDAHQSLQSQIALCIKYCKDNNLTVIDTIQEIVSGHNSVKQSYQSILDNNSNINLIIADASRLSRNVASAYNFVINCSKKNILIHSVRDNIITNSHQEYKKFINIVFDASIESSIISKRVCSSLKIRRQLGSHIGKIPYGYTCISTIDNKSGMRLRKLIENTKEQNIISFINQLYYGSKIPILYKLYKKITLKDDFRLYEDNGIEFNEVYYGNLRIKDIKHLLDLHSITKNGDNFTSYNIRAIVNKNAHYKHNYMN
jgi:DNA invertase Pin-like site-specific DNA recombinase